MKDFDKIFTKALGYLVVLVLVLAVCWGVLCLCVSCGLRAFACEMDVTEPCGMSTDELKAVLKHDLANYAEAFLQAEEDYGINACFLASIAAQESGWGRSKVAKNKNNLFGWQGDGGYKEFDSIEDCIDWVAWKLNKKYIGKGIDTLEEIAPVYCNEEWAEHIRDIWGGFLK